MTSDDMPSDFRALLVGGPLDGTELQVRGEHPSAMLEFPTAPSDLHRLSKRELPTDEELKPGLLRYRLATYMGPSTGTSAVARYKFFEHY